MYDLFRLEHPESTVKESYYRYIFSTGFNIAFHMPKSDICAFWEKFIVAGTENVRTSDLIKQKDNHI